MLHDLTVILDSSSETDSSVHEVALFMGCIRHFSEGLLSCFGWTPRQATSGGGQNKENELAQLHHLLLPPRSSKVLVARFPIPLIVHNDTECWHYFEC